jgi:outer membrane receptor protein involved in Fe transport
LSSALTAALVVFLVAQAPTPTVDGVADEADVLFSLGNEAYAKRDYERALSYYFSSNRLAQNKNVTFNLARCYERLERPVEAYRYYARYRELIGDGDDAGAAAAMKRLRPRLSFLSVSSEPSGAAVYIDRKELGAYGTTPLELALAPGTYDLLLERDGHVDAKADLGAMKAGEQREIKARLTPLLGTLVVTGTPEGAELRLRGELIGRVPSELPIIPGDHRVEVSAPGYETVLLPVEVRADEQEELRVALTLQTGTIVVQADESGIPVRLDGQVVGFTPVVIDGVTAGEHRLEVAAEGYRAYRVDVEVPGGGRVVVEASLEADTDVSAASRASESILDAPASVTLISRSELSALAPVNVMDAIAGTRGFFPNDDLTFASLGVRGFSEFGSYGNRVLMQIDGHTVNDNWLGGSFVGFDLLTDLSIVDRIEVVRGPGSSLYGTGAFFGVVNVGLPKTLPHTARGGVFSTGDGQAGGFADGGATFGKNAGFWVKAGGLVGQPFDYFSKAHVGSPEASDGVARGVGALGAGGAMGRAFWGDLDLVAYIQHRNKNPPTAPFGTTFGDLRTRDTERRGFVDLRYTPQVTDQLKLVLRTYLDHFHYDGVYPYVEDRIVQEESFEGDWGGAEVRVIYEPLLGLRLTGGAESELHFLAAGRGTDQPGDDVYYDESNPYVKASLFSNVDWAIGRWLRLSAGARFDAWWITNLDTQDPLFGQGVRFFSSFNPRFAAVLRPFEDTRLKLLLGRAFRAPSLFEMTYWDGGITQVQGPNLEPETIYTGELELSQVLPERFLLVGSVFVNRISDLIRLQGSGVSEDPSVFRNEATPIWTLGSEVELRKELSRGVFGSAQYSFQRTRVDDPVGEQRLPNSPEHIVGGRLVVPVFARTLRLGTRAYIEAGRLDRSGKTLDPALLWDLTLSGELRALGLSYHAGVKNLFDWRVSHPVGEDIATPTVPQMGRTFIAQVAYSY